MSYLETDKQTLADLSIVESMYDEHPLYSLYPATETKKGKRLMLHWITYHKWLKDFNDLLFNELLAYSKFF